MRTSELLLSSLDISEYNYYHTGQFYLSSESTYIKVNLSDVQNDIIIGRIKNVFNLRDDVEQIRDTLMDMLVEKAKISSRITEGENYEKKVLRI